MTNTRAVVLTAKARLALQTARQLSAAAELDDARFLHRLTLQMLQSGPP